jgi:Domain of unknown function (DUF4153)
MRELSAALAAGAVCGIAVPLTEPGIGWPIAGLAVLVAVLVAGPRRGWHPGRLAAGAGALLLVGAGALRAAGWLFLLCLAAAVPLASLAVAGTGRSWRRTARGAVAVLFAVPGAGELVRAVRLPRILPGAVAGVALTAVFAGLFASADPVFAHLLPRMSPGGVAGGLLLFGLGAAGTLGLARARVQPADDGAPPTARLRRLDWVLPLALLDVLFAVFVAVQLTVLFGGRGYVLGPGGPSYAEYARGGFWQLTTATLLTLAVVAVVAQWAARETPADRMLIRVLVGALSMLTLVIVASALRRMGLYVGAYGFTRVRLVAFAGEVVLGGLFVLVLAAGVRLRAPWLPAAAVATGVVALLGLVALNPDGYIARTVIARYHHDGHLDAAYLSVLSADAVPEIDRLPEPYRSCVLAGLAGRPSTVDRWYAVNAGRHTALRILTARPPARDAIACPQIFLSG